METSPHLSINGKRVVLNSSFIMTPADIVSFVLDEFELPLSFAFEENSKQDAPPITWEIDGFSVKLKVAKLLNELARISTRDVRFINVNGSVLEYRFYLHRIGIKPEESGYFVHLMILDGGKEVADGKAAQ